MIWTVVIACLVLAAYVYLRAQRRSDRTSGADDTGLAIVEFGRVFPNEAIREVITTAGGDGVFLRLHDGKVGCMRARGTRFTCLLIEPGGVLVHNSPSGKGLAIEFHDNPRENGSFEFSTSGEAAEVSLWLLGSLLPAAGIEEAPRTLQRDS